MPQLDFYIINIIFIFITLFNILIYYFLSQYYLFSIYFSIKSYFLDYNTKIFYIYNLIIINKNKNNLIKIFKNTKKRLTKKFLFNLKIIKINNYYFLKKWFDKF